MKCSFFVVAVAIAGVLPVQSAPALPAPISATIEGLFVESQAGPGTRADVRAELQLARASGTMALDDEIGDSQQVLDAREVFAELQREVVMHNLAAIARGQSGARRDVAEQSTR